jgi:hypothetical protein
MSVIASIMRAAVSHFVDNGAAALQRIARTAPVGGGAAWLGGAAQVWGGGPLPLGCGAIRPPPSRPPPASRAATPLRAHCRSV